MEAARFLRWAVAATVLPWLAVTLAQFVPLPGEVVMLSFAAVVLGVPHVATTGAFYFDPEMRDRLRSDPVRFYYAPFALVAVAVAVTITAPREALWLAVAGFSLWQLHHFTKQNLGMFSFVCKARGVPGPDAGDRRTIALTGWAAMLAALPFFYPRALGPVPTVIGGVLLAYAAVRVALGARAMDPVRLGALTVAVGFYLPLFLFDEPAAALIGYGAAHGAQYLLMVSHLHRGRDRRSSLRMLAAIAGLFAVGGWALTELKNGRHEAGQWTLAIVQGITMAHFVIDADLWRMRDPEQRAYMARRFSFLSGAGQGNVNVERPVAAG